MKVIDAGLDLNVRPQTISLRFDTVDAESGDNLTMSAPLPIELQSVGSPLGDIVTSLAIMVVTLSRKVDLLMMQRDHVGDIVVLEKPQAHEDQAERG